jgi:mono/diheme cytochrome c family protein
MKRRWIVGVIVIVAVSGTAGALWWLREERRGEITPAIRGQQIAVRLGCFGCHGPEGSGGIADPAAPGGEVPDWSYGIAKLFIACEQDIRDWILYGAPRAEAERREISGYEPLVPMPAYEDQLSDDELDDLVAYFLAVSGWAAEIPDEAYEGRKIATRLGCFGCHGPSGMGGVANPGSFKGHIPPWDGDEFDELVRDENELREWILEGRTKRLWDNPAAQVFLERQKISMPAYHDYLSDAELDKLVAYIDWLRAGRPGLQGEQTEADSVIAMISGVR